MGGKEKTVGQDSDKIKADEATIEQISSSVAWCRSTSENSKKLETTANGLLQAVQTLYTELNAASNQANPDNIFEDWVASQVGAIVSALKQLVKPEATDSFALIRPAVADKAVRTVWTPGEFSVETFAGLLGDMTAELVITSNAASLILKQPNLEFPLVPTIASHQAALETTCNDWTYIYSVEVVQILSSTAFVFASMHQNFLVMKNLSHVMPEQLTIGLQLANRRLKKLRDEVEKTSDSLTSHFLRLEIQKDRAVFGRDQINVQDYYEGDHGVLTKLQEEISTTQNEIDTYQAKVAKGATSTVVKALGMELVIVFGIGLGSIAIPAVAEGAGVLSVVACKGLTPAVKAGSTAVKKWGTNELLEAIGGNDAEEKGQSQIDEFRNLIIAQGQLNSALTSFAVVSQQIENLCSAGLNLVHAVDMIPLEIDILCRNIDLLQVEVDAGQDVSEDKLDSISKSCDQLSQVCDNLTQSYLASGIEM